MIHRLFYRTIFAVGLRCITMHHAGLGWWVRMMGPSLVQQSTRASLVGRAHLQHTVVRYTLHNTQSHAIVLHLIYTWFNYTKFIIYRNVQTSQYRQSHCVPTSLLVVQPQIWSHSYVDINDTHSLYMNKKKSTPTALANGWRICKMEIFVAVHIGAGIPTSTFVLHNNPLLSTHFSDIWRLIDCFRRCKVSTPRKKNEGIETRALGAYPS